MYMWNEGLKLRIHKSKNANAIMKRYELDDIIHEGNLEERDLDCKSCGH